MSIFSNKDNFKKLLQDNMKEPELLSSVNIDELIIKLKSDQSFVYLHEESIASDEIIADYIISNYNEAPTTCKQSLLK